MNQRMACFNLIDAKTKQMLADVVHWGRQLNCQLQNGPA